MFRDDNHGKAPGNSSLEVRINHIHISKSEQQEASGDYPRPYRKEIIQFENASSTS